MRMLSRFGNVVLAATLLLLGAGSGASIAGEKIVASSTQNAPPAVALSSYDRFEMTELAMDKPYAGQKVNDKARDTLAVHVQGQVLPWVIEKKCAGCEERATETAAHRAAHRQDQDRQQGRAVLGRGDVRQVAGAGQGETGRRSQW